MKLQTEISLEKQSNHLIDYSSNILLLGSCFAENIGEKLDYFKFQNFQNPFGVIFNPVSIEKLIQRAVLGNFYTEKNIFLKEGQWHCFEVQSLVSSKEKKEYLTLLNDNLTSLKKYITKASHIIFSYGTAWVYEYKVSSEIVANCHKIPQQEFLKKLLQVDTIQRSIETSLKLIENVNPLATIITTVSPVRHTKDGIVENSQSKAHLITAIHRSLNQNSNISNLQSFYFPSFELMMDELRDYRFYKKDLIHPNEIAIDIIWEKFKSVWINPVTENLQEEIDSIQKGLKHKPLNKESDSHNFFLENLQNKISILKKNHPSIKF